MNIDSGFWRDLKMYKGLKIFQSLTSDLDDGRTLHLKLLNLVFPGPGEDYEPALPRNKALLLS